MALQFINTMWDFLNTTEGKFIKYWTSLLLILVALYVCLHFAVSGSIDTRLTKDDITTVTLILSDTTSQSVVTPSALYSIRKANAIEFILNQLNPKDKAAVTKLSRQVAILDVSALIATLPSISISSQYYFWLNTDWKYFEVIFWTIFGVIANLLYKSSDAIGKGTFDRTRELTLYVAKIYYAPMISLVIVFSYSMLIGSNEVHFDSTSLELLVFSFILGFFSSRAVELLNKLKDALLPGGKGEEEPVTASLTGKVEPPAGTPAMNLEDTEITLTPLRGQEAALTTKAGDDGMYSFSNVKPGEYKLEAKLSDDGVGTFTALVEKMAITKSGSISADTLLLKKQQSAKGAL